MSLFISLETQVLDLFDLPLSDKYNLDKITASCVWRSLERVKPNLEA